MEFYSKSVEHLRFVHFTIIITLSALLIATLFDQNKLFDNAIKEIEIITAITKNTPSLNGLFNKVINDAVTKSKHNKLIKKYIKDEHNTRVEKEDFSYVEELGTPTFLEKYTWTKVIGKLSGSEGVTPTDKDLSNLKIDTVTNLAEFKYLWDISESLVHFDAITGRDTSKLLLIEKVAVSNFESVLATQIPREIVCSKDRRLSKGFSTIGATDSYYPSHIFDYGLINCSSKKNIFNSYVTEIYIKNENQPANGRLISQFKNLDIYLISNTHKSIDIELQKALIRQAKTDRTIINGNFKESFPSLNILFEKYPFVKFDELSINGKGKLNSLNATVQAMKSSTSNMVSILSINIPAEVIFPWGTIILMIMLIYFYMHLKEYANKLTLSRRENNPPAEEVPPWIGIYKNDYIAKFVTLISLCLLPIIITMVSYLNNSIKGVSGDGHLGITLVSIFTIFALISNHYPIRKKIKNLLLERGILNYKLRYIPFFIAVIPCIYVCYLYQRNEAVGWVVTFFIVTITFNIFILLEKCWQEIN